MNNITTHPPLRVRTSDVGPYLKLPLAQVDAVCRVLDRHGIRYLMDDIVMSLNGGPERTSISFHESERTEKIQAILDAEA